MTPVVETEHRSHATPGYLRLIWQHKLVVLLFLLVVPGAALAASLQQKKLYQASAQVFVKRQNLATLLTGAVDTSINQPDDRIMQTQADLAGSPEVFADALRRAKISPAARIQLVNGAAVAPKANSDFLVFLVTSSEPQVAARLVNAYANAYTTYRRQLDTTATREALVELENRIRQVRSDKSQAGLLAQLVAKEQQLQTIQALQTSNAFVTKQAGGAGQIQPRPTRDTALGAIIGLVLGIAFALILDRLDTRVRSESEVGELLRAPLIGRLAAPPAKARGVVPELATLTDPTGRYAESFAMLAVALDLVQVGETRRTIMVTSSLAQEGKSTTVANLAVALARGGKRVRVVDLDLRRPTLSRFFNVETPVGLTDVARGRVRLEDALVHVPLDASTNGADAGDLSAGRLSILPTGVLPPSPSDFLRTTAFGRVVQDLRDGADVVLIDAPPMLPVSDALTASASVDALILAVQIDRIRRPQLRELVRLVASSPSEILGYVVTGVDLGGGYAGYAGYAGYYGPIESARERRLKARGRRQADRVSADA
jgi:capsular exopolysaccharide synthesis family protein